MKPASTILEPCAARYAVLVAGTFPQQESERQGERQRGCCTPHRVGLGGQVQQLAQLGVHETAGVRGVAAAARARRANKAACTATDD